MLVFKALADPTRRAIWSGPHGAVGDGFGDGQKKVFTRKMWPHFIKKIDSERKR
jgi:hypothetical protein